MGCPPQPPLKIKFLGKLAPADCQASRRGPRRVPSSPEPPARRGEKGGPRNSLRQKKRERKKMISSRPQWSSVAIPALAMARNELAAVARLKIPVALRPPFSVWGYWAISGCPPCAADVDFIKSAQAEFQPPSYDGATCCTCRGRLGSSLLGLVFGVVLGVVRGSFYP